MLDWTPKVDWSNFPIFAQSLEVFHHEYDSSATLGREVQLQIG